MKIFSLLVLIFWTLLLFLTAAYSCYLVFYMLPRMKKKHDSKTDKTLNPTKRNFKEDYMKPTPDWTCSTYSSEQRKRLFKE